MTFGTRHGESHQLAAFEERLRHLVSFAGDQLHRDRAVAGSLPLCRKACGRRKARAVGIVAASIRSAPTDCDGPFRVIPGVGCRAQRRLIPPRRASVTRAVAWGDARFAPTRRLTRADHTITAPAVPREPEDQLGMRSRPDILVSLATDPRSGMLGRGTARGALCDGSRVPPQAEVRGAWR